MKSPSSHNGDFKIPCRPNKTSAATFGPQSVLGLQALVSSPTTFCLDGNSLPHPTPSDPASSLSLAFPFRIGDLISEEVFAVSRTEHTSLDSAFEILPCLT